eukprot:1648260-Amphidinium_carterae.1
MSVSDAIGVPQGLAAHGCFCPEHGNRRSVRGEVVQQKSSENEASPATREIAHSRTVSTGLFFEVLTVRGVKISNFWS